MAYEYPPAPSLHEDTLEEEAPRPLSLFYVIVAVFIIGAVSVSTLAGWALAVKALGAVLLVGFIFRSFQVRVRLGLEVYLYLAWMLWALFAIIGSNVYADQFVTNWLTVAQIWLLIVILSGYVDSRKTLVACLIAFLFGAMIVGGYSYLTGEYQTAEGNDRISGLARNANAFGRTMVWGTMIAALLWMTRMKIGYLKYVVLGILMVFFAIWTVLSGSRFSTLGLALLYVMWVWFCYRKTVLRRPGLLVAIILATVIGGYAFMNYASESVVGKRMNAAWMRVSGKGFGGDAGRIGIYGDAAKVAVENPLVGVGLGNFIIHSSTGLYSHSDYAEVAADTGIPGFLIYFSIYIVLWRRCGRIIRNSDDPATIQTTRFIRAAILVVLFLSLGTVNYMNKPVWIILACFIGYTNATWHSIQQRMLAYGPQEIEIYPNNSPAEPYNRQPEQSPAVATYDDRLNTAQD